MAPPVTPSPHRFVLDEEKPQTHSSSAIRPTQFRKRPSFHFSGLVNTAQTDSPSSTVQDEVEVDYDNTKDSKSLGPAVQDADLIASFDTANGIIQETAKKSANSKPPADGARELSPNDSPTTVASAAVLDCDFSPTAKRMKFSTQRQFTDHSPDQIKSTWLGSTQASHRFLSTLAQTDTEVEDAGRVISRRQAFIRPSSPQADKLDIEPHLVQFSPHRKGKTYEPGGLAATMQSHLMDMTSAGSFALSGVEQRPWLFTVTERETSTPFVLVNGMLENGQSGRFILPGSKVVPVIGDVVRVQGITWICELDDCHWLVCVDWGVVK